MNLGLIIALIVVVFIIMGIGIYLATKTDTDANANAKTDAAAEAAAAAYMAKNEESNVETPSEPAPKKTTLSDLTTEGKWKLAWNTNGSGFAPMSLWVAEEGDGFGVGINRGTDRPPSNPPYIIKAGQEGYFKRPLEYYKIWDDGGSGANEDLAIVAPKCPADYAPLGDAVMVGGGVYKGSIGNPYPNVGGESWCIPKEFLTKSDNSSTMWESQDRSNHQAKAYEDPNGYAMFWGSVKPDYKPADYYYKKV